MIKAVFAQVLCEKLSKLQVDRQIQQVKSIFTCLGYQYLLNHRESALNTFQAADSEGTVTRSLNPKQL
jgi:hypothetical protein